MTDSTTNPGPSTGNTLDVVHDSLLRRMRTMHGLYHQAVDTMDLEHVNHFEREGVLPIAFSLFHPPESPCSTATNAGSINTACATWARSNSHEASSAWAA